MVSSVGGVAASWSRARPELVFAAPATDYMYVHMVARYHVLNGSFRVDKPHLWAEHAPPLREMLGARLYTLHPDGVQDGRSASLRKREGRADPPDAGPSLLR